MLSAPQMAQMSRLLETALELDLPGRRSWLEALAPEYQNLLPALRRALLPEDEEVSVSQAVPSLGVGIPDSLIGSGLQAGEILGPYRLVRPLAAGGMAEVWLAQRADGTLKREVALKLPILFRLRKDLTSRFERERDILAALVHPNIARLYDAGVSRDGLPYLAMEYVVGAPITTYCDDHRLSIHARLELFRQVLNAVQYAHANLVIHRDIKPSNILVTESGQVQLLDFGIAKILSEGEARETRLTQLGGRALTPDYAAPEQIAGGPLTTAADVYALGVLLYELLTGERPYRLKRNSLGALEEAILQTEPVPPSRFAVDERSAEARATTTTKLAKVLKGDLDAITLRALKKFPGNRYASASEFAEDVARFLRGDVVLAQPDGAAYRVIKFAKRYRVAIGGISALILVLAGGLAATSYEAYVAAGQRDSARQAQQRALTQTAAARLKDGDVAGAMGVVLEVLPRRGGAQPYTAEALGVFQEARAGDREVLRMIGHSGWVLSAVFSPDGQRILTASFDKTARIWNAANGQQVLLLGGHTERVVSAAFSPDGRLVATASWDKTARIWDSETGEQLRMLMGHTDRLTRVTFSADGRRIVTASFDRSARIWDAETGSQLLLLGGHSDGLIGAAFSPDGRRIVTASADRTARVWDAATGRQLLVLRGHTERVTTASFSPDGERIVTASGDRTARTWDAATGQQILVLTGHLNQVGTTAFSSDGRYIVTSSYDGTVRTWDAANGGQLLALSGHRDLVTGAAFSSDGRYVVTSSYDGTARIWDVASREQLRVLTGHTEALESAAFSPDGRFIVTASDDKTARIWNAAGGQQPLRVLNGHAANVFSAAFSPDGRGIVTASLDKTARIWGAADGALIRVLSGHTDGVTGATFSPDGRYILTSSMDKTAGIWDADTGNRLRVFTGQAHAVLTAAFSPDGGRIITASSDKTARIWDSRTTQQLLILSGHTDAVNWAAFSPDGRLVVTASNDKTARIWDAASGRELRILSGHTDFVIGAAFSPDGQRVVSVSQDKTARVWDTSTGRQMQALRGHEHRVENAEFSRDGQRIITASSDKTARIWDARTVVLAAQLSWADAAQFDPLSDPDRVQLGLPVRADVHPWAVEQSKCDQSAGAPYDPLRRAPGVLLDQIVTDIASVACGQDHGKSDESPRSIYERGRVRMAGRDFVGARRIFEQALAFGYPAAEVDLGMLLSEPSARMLDVVKATSLYDQAWKGGVPIAAFELGNLYEHGVSQGDTSTGYALVPDEIRAWSWYQKGADAGEPNALARFGEREDRAGFTADDPAVRTAHLLQAFRYYTSAAERARLEDWPDMAWRDWRYRRASIARLLARDGMMERVADEYDAIVRKYATHTTTWQRVGSLLRMN